MPRTRLPEVLARIGEIARRHGLTVANVFHAGDGNLHPNILFDRRDPAELEKVERASKEIMTACVEAGGTITGEHGVGIDKRRYMTLVHGPAELEAMAAVKEVFDPGARFNPGKVLPEGPAAAPPPEPRGGAGPVSRIPDTTREGGAPARSGGVIPALEAILGGDRVAEDSRGGPPLVSPRSTEEVAVLLEAATASGWRVSPAGRGVHPGAAGRRSAADLVLSTSALRSVLEYEPADLTLTAQAGLDLAGVAAATGAHGQWLPLDPPGPLTATLGGSLATGIAGALAGRYGAPRDLVLGLTCVTGDGRVLRLGGRVVKNVAGFDLVKLLVGSRGRLGVIVDATLRLFPLPAADRVLVAEAESLEALVALLRAVAGAPLVPAALVAGEPGGEEAPALAVVRLAGSRAAVD
ncbi:MAG TPA: FAD-linked oxidase C-terminal domain-containing protein, partial [Longimicrobiales bacterium]|nr:FAD-linked oxidase C-terminal domain-containing protein [Longimicrobiales bacterium]